MSVGVAVALREHELGVGCVEGSVAGGAALHFRDAVIGGVEWFSGIDAVGVVPVEAVIGWGGGGAWGEEVVPAAEEGEGFLHEGGDLAFEGEAGGFDIADGRLAGDLEGGIGGVVPCLVAEGHVEVVEVSGDEQKGAVDGFRGDAGVQALLADAVEDGFVDFDEAEVIDAGEREGDIAFPAGAGLGEEADVGADGVVVEVGLALVEGIDAIEDAFDPAVDEDRLAPFAGGGTGDDAAVFSGPVAHGEVGVREDEKGVAERRGGRSADDDGIGEGAGGSDPWGASGVVFGSDEVLFGFGVEAEVGGAGGGAWGDGRVERDGDGVLALAEEGAVDFELEGEGVRGEA